MKIFKILLISVLIISCEQKVPIEKLVRVDTLTTVTETTYNAMGAYFSADSYGNLILSWSEEIDTLKTNILKFKIFKNFGRCKINCTTSQRLY